MGHVKLSLAYDIGNFYTCITLAMPILAGKAFTTSELLKYDHFRAFYFIDQLSVHNRLCYVGSADFNGCSIVNEENMLKLYLPIWVGIKQFYIEDISNFNSVLLTASFNDCVHVTSYESQVSSGEEKEHHKETGP